MILDGRWISGRRNPSAYVCDQNFQSTLVDELPNVSEVMVVMLGDEVQVVDQSHGRLHAGMNQRMGKLGRIELIASLDEARASVAEFFEDLVGRAGIVIGIVSFPVLQIGDGKFHSPVGEVFDARHP